MLQFFTETVMENPRQHKMGRDEFRQWAERREGARSVIFTPSEMRRMSRCVTGVPLPGWMFSAFMTTHSLPSRSSTLPLRTELAITFTTVDHSCV